MTITAFRINIPDTALEDLHERLTCTRWPGELPGVGWSCGVPQNHLKALADYWRTGYDWRAEEARINAFPQFTTEIDGANIHFIHLRSPQPAATPLLLIHGWPGSIVEFLSMIGPLADPKRHGGEPADAFHIVVPSIPGYGFSDPISATGWNTTSIAKAFSELMARLGYQRYGVHGGDMGSLIGRQMGMADPDHVIGAHVLQAFAFPSGDPAEMEGLTEEDRRRLARLTDFQKNRKAYATLQSTRPQTLAYALTDSPVGQLAWNLDFIAGCGDTVDALSRDQILTNVMLYWLTGTAGSAAQLYYENAHSGSEDQQQPSTFPMGIAVFPTDFLSIRPFAERDNKNIVHWTEFDRGGHFAAMEVPELLIEDVRAFFRSLRRSDKP